MRDSGSIKTEFILLFYWVNYVHMLTCVSPCRKKYKTCKYLIFKITLCETFLFQRTALEISPEWPGTVVSFHPKLENVHNVQWSSRHDIRVFSSYRCVTGGQTRVTSLISAVSLPLVHCKPVKPNRHWAADIQHLQGTCRDVEHPRGAAVQRLRIASETNMGFDKPSP